MAVNLNKDPQHVIRQFLRCFDGNLQMLSTAAPEQNTNAIPPQPEIDLDPHYAFSTPEPPRVNPTETHVDFGLLPPQQSILLACNENNATAAVRQSLAVGFGGDGTSTPASGGSVSLTDLYFYRRVSLGLTHFLRTDVLFRGQHIQFCQR